MHGVLCEGHLGKRDASLVGLAEHIAIVPGPEHGRRRRRLPVLNDLDVAVDCKVEYKTQYLLRVDVLRNKVEYYPQGTGQIRSQLFASDCCAYFQGLEDHQVILLTNTANHV